MKILDKITMRIKVVLKELDTEERYQEREAVAIGVFTLLFILALMIILGEVKL